MHWVSVRKDTVHSPLMCGVESLQYVGFDPPTWGDFEAVFAGPLPDCFQLLSGSTRPRDDSGAGRFRAGFSGGGDFLCDLDIWGECRFDLVGIGGSQINPIVGALVGEGDFVSQSGVDGFSVEIVDKLANKYFGHRESFSLRAG